MSRSTRLIFVTGANGAQGGATMRALLATGYAVRFLTRRIESPRTRELIQLGAEAVAGNLDDARCLEAATRNVSGVFSVQMPDSFGTDSERRQGQFHSPLTNSHFGADS